MRIVADSSVMFSVEEGARRGMAVLPLTVSIDGATWLEYEDISSEEFLALVRAGALPQSASPPPALTLAAYQWMDKTHHRPLLPSFDKFGRFVARIMLPMALVLVILMVPSYLASNSNQYYYGAAHMFGENTRLGADTAAIEETFGRSDTYVVLVPEGDTATQQKLAEIELVKQLIHDTPVLLLDDVLSELDSNRQNYLLNSIHDIQTIITCTGLDEFVKNRFHINKVFFVREGTIAEQ